MNTRKAWRWMSVGITLVLAGCASGYRVGELRTESKTVEVGDADSVRVDIEFGAGELRMTGGAPDLLEADFTYNVDKLRPAVEYSDGSLVIRQPDVRGEFADFQVIRDFRSEWDLRFNNGVPMELILNMGAGTSDLRLGDLLLTRLDVNLGAGRSTIDLTGDWANDLEAVIMAGAADLTVRLPSDVGVRVEVESGPMAVSAPGFSQAGTVYTNTAFGVSAVTLRIDIQAGIGVITLELE